MVNTSAISRGSLILGLCLPLAVVLGYMLAEPLDSASIGVVLLLLSVLSIPILMRWHHPLLILCWNACLNPFFIPGRPFIWMLMALAAFFFAALSRATDANRRFLSAPQVSLSLLFLGFVVAMTAIMRGGFGLNTFGAERQGGKGYFYILFAVIGYFAMTSRGIPRARATAYVAMFFLSALTSVISNLAYLGGTKFYFLYDLFPPDLAASQAFADVSVTGGVSRIIGLTLASQATWCWLLARYGIGGVFDFARPWRILLLIVSVCAGLLGGFRSLLVSFALVFTLLFWLEKGWRSPRVLLTMFVGTAAVTVGLLLFSEQLPLSAQRALSFLPIRIDAATRLDADFSTQWRIEIWRRVLPDVPKYLFKGKGYSLDPNDLYLASESIQRGNASGGEIAILAGDYHNGPLSVIIPFGVWGLLAFVWFVSAAIWTAWHNYRYGDEMLRGLNRFLLALLIAKVISFVFIYGSLYAELFQFTGLIGLSVSLNGGVARPRRLDGSST